MKKYYVDLKRAPGELKNGLQRIVGAMPLTFEDTSCPEICFKRHGDGVNITSKADRLMINYREVNDAFRALGLINARPKIDAPISEQRSMDKTFLMLDVSRNGVLNKQSVGEWLDFLALTGVNGFMLYTEDTYEVPGEDYFGYMRGRYGMDELKAYDQIAFDYGIEMIPCIQTLGHLERVLAHSIYAPLRDTRSILMCREEETYRFIEKMLKAASAPYRSKRIHIGMDEANQLGRGSYYTKHGHTPPFELMAGHLGQVMTLARKHGLKPMMWSDMLFRALSKERRYYDSTVIVDEHVTSCIPADLDLVYWDYYHYEEAEYDAMLDKHIEMGKAPLFCTGIWSWSRFWTADELTEKTLVPGLTSAIKKGVKEVLVSVWGDHGTECDYYSAFPMIQFASDMIFTGQADRAVTKTNLIGSAGIDLDDWRVAGEIDCAPFLKNYPTLAKTFFWEDPLYGFYQPQLEGNTLNDHFKSVASKLRKSIKKPGNERLMLPFLLADILSEKADLPTLLKQAYDADDRDALHEIASKVVPRLIRKVRKMNVYHRALWVQNYKPFGWEVLERRYGGLLGVFENLKSRLEAYLAGQTECLEELEETRLKLHDTSAETFPGFVMSELCSMGVI